LITLNEEGDVFDASGTALHLAQEMGFGALESNLIASAVSEIATNAVRYAGKGTVLFSVTGNKRGLSIVVEDKGPGIPDLEAAMQDGHSSLKTSLGVGLGAAKRAMDDFQVQTAKGRGTKVTMYKYLPMSDTVEYGMVSLADDHYAFNGDELVIREFDGDKILLAVIDGLGQGESAQRDAQQVKQIIQAQRTLDLEGLVMRCDQSLREEGKGGGVSLGLMLVQPGALQYIGVGDTFAHVFPAGRNSFSGRSGILGSFKLPALRVEKQRRSAEGLTIVLCTDGIRDRFSKDDLPLNESAQRIADHIMRHYRREFGDATVLVAKLKKG